MFAADLGSGRDFLVDVCCMPDTRWYIVWSQRIWALSWSCHGILVAGVVVLRCSRNLKVLSCFSTRQVSATRFRSAFPYIIVQTKLSENINIAVVINWDLFPILRSFRHANHAVDFTIAIPMSSSSKSAEFTSHLPLQTLILQYTMA